RAANNVCGAAQECFLWDQCHGGADAQPAKKTTEMCDNVAGGIESEQGEQQDSSEDAGRDVSAGSGIFEPNRKRLNGQQSESTHDHAGSAKTVIGVLVEEKTGDISPGARQKAGQPRAGGAVTAHRETKNRKSNHQVCHQMSQIKMQPHGGKKSPPRSALDSARVHEA